MKAVSEGDRKQGPMNKALDLFCRFSTGLALMGFVFGPRPSIAQITSTHPNPETVTVHVAPSGSERVPDTLFGGFLEPIPIRMSRVNRLYIFSESGSYPKTA